jgi:hypothetical protein
MTVGLVVAGTDPADIRGILHSAPAFTVIPDDVDLPSIEKDLQGDHVSAPSDDVAGLERVVADAKAKGHDMYFVVLEQSQPNFTYYRDIATALQKQTGGTVVVFGPDTVGTASNDFSRVQLEQAQDNLTVSQPTLAAQQMLDRMTVQTQTPWTVVTLVLIAVVALGAVAARFVQLRRRAESPAVATPGGAATPDAAPTAAADPDPGRRNTPPSA